ncbi:hypothetical protein JHK82_040099 [Glycine max]|nr:hypothetical protein JHK82_040099 [Glycine max]
MNPNSHTKKLVRLLASVPIVVAVVGAQSSKLSTLPVNKLIVLFLVFKLDESYTPSKVSIRAGDGFHNLKEIKTVELVKATGWAYLSLSGADPR